MSANRTSQDPELLRRLLRAKDKMDAASHEEWPVRRLARVSGVSEAHFARSFKQAFGVPPHRYLLTRRVERARALLRETDLAVTDIASGCSGSNCSVASTLVNSAMYFEKPRWSTMNHSRVCAGSGR